MSPKNLVEEINCLIKEADTLCCKISTELSAEEIKNLPQTLECVILEINEFAQKILTILKNKKIDKLSKSDYENFVLVLGGFRGLITKADNLALYLIEKFPKAH